MLYTTLSPNHSNDVLTEEAVASDYGLSCDQWRMERRDGLVNVTIDPAHYGSRYRIVVADDDGERLVTVCDRCHTPRREDVGMMVGRLVFCRECSRYIDVSSTLWNTGADCVCRDCARARRQARNAESENELKEYKALRERYDEKKEGEIVKSLRRFGVEIECLIPPSGYGSINLPKGVEHGGDGSIEGEGIGVEFKTPPLSGSIGEDVLSSTLLTLRGLGAKVNSSCGLHVHIDAGDYRKRPDDMRVLRLWTLYQFFLPVFQSFLPIRRRSNRFCKPNAFIADLERPPVRARKNAAPLWYNTDRSEVYRHMREHYHSSRYYAMNLHCYFNYGHVEFRSHSGTLNAKKILHWVQLHAALMDIAPKMTRTRFEKMIEPETITTLEKKTRKLFEVTNLPKESRTYFLERQKKFETSTDERFFRITDVNEKIKCVA